MIRVPCRPVRLVQEHFSATVVDFRNGPSTASLERRGVRTEPASRDALRPSSAIQGVLLFRPGAVHCYATARAFGAFRLALAGCTDRASSSLCGTAPDPLPSAAPCSCRRAAGT